MIVAHFRGGPEDGNKRLLEDAVNHFEIAVDPGPAIPTNGWVKMERAEYELCGLTAGAALYRFVGIKADG